MSTGKYSRALRSMMKHPDQKDVLDLWVNNNESVMENEGWITLDYLRDPGMATACHNVASTLVNKAGVGALEILVSTAVDIKPAIDHITEGGYIMEIKFHEDHSVVLISSRGDSQVEILEGWAGGGEGLGVQPYRFSRSVYEDHEKGRISKAVAAKALQGAADGAREQLAQNVQLLTRCVAGACGIQHDPFMVTVKLKSLKKFDLWNLTTQNEITAATTNLARLVYEDVMAHVNGGVPAGLRCTQCFRKLRYQNELGRWHHCPTCKLAYCHDCGRRFLVFTRRTCPANHKLQVI